MLRVVLAEWFRHYFSRNEWRFLQRDATAGGIDEKDFTTWDLPRIMREIDTLYQDVLKDAALLKKIPVSVYRDFLAPGNQPAGRRPTLFDFVAFEALDFYASGERAASAPEDAFVLEADSPALGPADEFLGFKPETTDADSPTLRAVRLYQELLAFHRGDADADVFLDADLHRLQLMKSLAAGESGPERYIARLKEIAEAHPASVLSSQADYLRAREIASQRDLVQAYAVADRGRKAHPLSLGGKNCDVLMTEITSRDYDVRNERVVPPGKPSRLAVSYRNITALHFRAVKDDFDSLLASKEGESLFWMNDAQVNRILGRQAAAAWKADLPPTSDYKERRETIELPPLEPGFYRLMASVEPDFTRGKRNKISAGSFWVSDWGLVTVDAGGAIEGFVVRNDSGDPAAGFDVLLYEWDYDKDVFLKKGTAQTDSQGAFSLPGIDSYRNRVLVARKAGRTEVVETQVQAGASRSRELRLPPDDLFHRPVSLPAGPDDPFQRVVSERGRE